MTASDDTGTTITVAIVADAPIFSTGIAVALGASSMLWCAGICQTAEDVYPRTRLQALPHRFRPSHQFSVALNSIKTAARQKKQSLGVTTQKNHTT